MNVSFLLVRFSMLAGLGVVSFAVNAAPLDALQTIPAANAPRFHGELAYDLVNDTVDVFGVRASDEEFAGTNVGDYSGFHLGGRVMVAPDVWVEGVYWDRELEYREDTAAFTSQQLAVGYRLPRQAYGLDFGVKLGMWRNSAGVLTKSSTTAVGDRSLDSISLYDPEDQQYQLNFLAAGAFHDNWRFTAISGLGHSKVDFGYAKGVYTRSNGCQYGFAFKADAGYGYQIGECGDVVSANVIYPDSASLEADVGVNPSDDLVYSSTYWQLGGNLAYLWNDWQFTGGYLMTKFNRSGIDDRIEAEGKSSTTLNQTLIGEAAWRFRPQWTGFVRAEFMSAQLLDTVPFGYNTYTAHRFDKQWGYVSLGLKVDLP